jgi:hypothetical protein
VIAGLGDEVVPPGGELRDPARPREFLEPAVQVVGHLPLSGVAVRRRAEGVDAWQPERSAGVAVSRSRSNLAACRAAMSARYASGVSK